MADDHSIVLAGLRKLVEADSEVVGTVEDGRALVEEAQKLRPDIILLDNYMPVMTGPEALERLKENPKTKDISVIMVTAANRIADIDHADKCGVDDYIIKPFVTHDLVVKIEAIMERKKVLVS